MPTTPQITGGLLVGCCLLGILLSVVMNYVYNKSTIEEAPESFKIAYWFMIPFIAGTLIGGCLLGFGCEHRAS